MILYEGIKLYHGSYCEVRNPDLSKCRSGWDCFDVMAGKIANDNTNLVITAYLDGLYGEVGSIGADNIAIGFLEPDNLKDQICFRTEKVLSSIRFSNSRKISI